MKRTCTRCHDTKDISEYSRDSKGKGGFAARCKLCKRNVKKSIKENVERSHKKMGSCCPKKPVSIVALKFMSQGNPEVFKQSLVSTQQEGNTPMLKSTQRRLAHLEGPEAYSKELNSRKDNGHDIEPLLTEIEKSMIKAIDRKFPKPKVLAWNDKRATLQIFNSPTLSWKADTVDEVLEKALSY